MQLQMTLHLHFQAASRSAARSGCRPVFWRRTLDDPGDRRRGPLPDLAVLAASRPEAAVCMGDRPRRPFGIE